MKKIDSYIVKRYIGTFFYAILLLSIITIIVDLSEKTDVFNRSGLSFEQIITKYYLGFLPHTIAQLFPLFAFISVIFFTSKLAGRSEIIAIFASGISFGRLLRPYMFCAGLLALILWLGFRYVLPPANIIFSDFQIKYVDRLGPAPDEEATIYFRVGGNRYASITGYDTATKTGQTFILNTVDKNQLTNNLRAERLVWDTTGGKGKWELMNVVKRMLSNKGETVIHYDKITMAFDFMPGDIKKDEYTKDKLTTQQLDHFIDQQNTRGAGGTNDLYVERYKRTATPFSIILLTLIGFCVSSQRKRGGTGLHLAIGFISAVTFILIDRFSTVFSTKGNLSPIIAAWLPNAIFIFVAIYFYRKAPK